MKKNLYNKLFLSIFLIMVFACMAIIQVSLFNSKIVNSKNVALMETTNPTVAVKIPSSVSDITNKVTLSYEDAKNENYYINLKILNFDFQIGDKVVYMVIAPNTQKYYPLFQGTDNAVIDITSNNIGLKAEVRIKPLNYFVNVGTYTVLATIIHNGEQFSTNYIDIEIDLPAESNYQLQISYQEIKGNQNELSTYYLSAKIFLNSEQINADNMLISWYLQNNNEPFRRMNSDFEWKPEEPGIYTISAKIEGLASGLTIESKNPIVITAVYNNSSTIFMWIGIIVGVAVLGLVVVIIIKVKSEKVW